MRPLLACLWTVLGYCLLGTTAAGEELLVARCGGEAVVFRDAPGGPVRKSLAPDAWHLAVTRSGHFVVGDSHDHWSKGTVDAELNVARQALTSVPSWPHYFAISEDGRRLAWATSHELIVQEYNGNQPTLLVKLTGDGAFLRPSWSPDGKQLAFYAVAEYPSCDDGYVLMILNVDDADKGPVRITPPSFLNLNLWISDGMTRFHPPLWSPDGKSIVFEGSYQDFDMMQTLYIVSVDGRHLRPCRYHGTWDLEGKHLLALKAKKKGSDECDIVEADVLHNGKENLLQELKYPEGFLEALSPSLSGKKVAYIQHRAFAGLSPAAQQQAMSHGLVHGQDGKDDELFIYDAAKKQTISCGTGFFPMGQPLIWITPGEAVTQGPTHEARPAEGPTIKVNFPEKRLKNKRLLELVKKLRDKECKRNHIRVSAKDARAITKFFLKENGIDETYALPPDDSLLKKCQALEEVRIRNKNPDEVYKAHFAKKEISKDTWKGLLDSYKTPEEVRRMRASIPINFEEMIVLNQSRIQKRVEQWLLFQKVLGTDGVSKDDMLQQQEREQAWWSPRLEANRELIDDDITDDDILFVITNKFDLSEAAEAFLMNYFEAKPKEEQQEQRR